MDNSIIGSIMNVTAEIHKQMNKQSPTSGTIQREWGYYKTVRCKIQPLKAGAGGSQYDSEKFDMGVHHEYDEKKILKMKSPIHISKRWRVTNIRTSDNKKVYIEIDKIDTPDTIFEVTSSHAVLDPFGRISYYEVTLQRAHVQNDKNTGE